jgi:hypothetical protein
LHKIKDQSNTSEKVEIILDPNASHQNKLDYVDKLIYQSNQSTQTSKLEDELVKFHCGQMHMADLFDTIVLAPDKLKLSLSSLLGSMEEVNKRFPKWYSIYMEHPIIKSKLANFIIGMLKKCCDTNDVMVEIMMNILMCKALLSQIGNKIQDTLVQYVHLFLPLTSVKTHANYIFDYFVGCDSRFKHIVLCALKTQFTNNNIERVWLDALDETFHYIRRRVDIVTPIMGQNSFDMMKSVFMTASYRQNCELTLTRLLTFTDINRACATSVLLWYYDTKMLEFMLLNSNFNIECSEVVSLRIRRTPCLLNMVVRIKKIAFSPHLLLHLFEVADNIDVCIGYTKCYGVKQLDN